MTLDQRLSDDHQDIVDSGSIRITRDFGPATFRSITAVF